MRKPGGSLCSPHHTVEQWLDFWLSDVKAHDGTRPATLGLVPGPGGSLRQASDRSGETGPADSAACATAGRRDAERGDITGAPAQRGSHGQQLQSPQSLWELASQLSEQIPSNISQPVSRSVAGLQVFTRSGRTAPVTRSRRIPATRLAFKPPGSSVRLRESSGTSASSSTADVKESRPSPYRLSGSQKSSLRIYGDA